MHRFITPHIETLGLFIAVFVLCCLLCVVEMFRPKGRSEPESRAIMDLRNLDQSVAAYEFRCHALPASLELLTERSADGLPPTLAENMLIDPWGRRYQYDVSQRHSESGKPLIWTEGKEPGKPGSKITNWEVNREIK